MDGRVSDPCAGAGGERVRSWDPEKEAVSAGAGRADLLAKGVPVRGNITWMRMKENCDNIAMDYALQLGTHVPGNYTSLCSPCYSLFFGDQCSNWK